MQKFFVETKQIKNEKITIIGEDVKHITSVLRMKVGEVIQIGNKETSENYIAKIAQIGEENVITNIIKKVEETSESNVQIDLYQGLPKADKMELIIQKTTEIGVSKIIPVEMTRCVVKLEEKEAKKKTERWQKIALSAAEQSKRDKIPTIENKINLKQIIEKIKEYDCFLVAYEEEHQITLKQALQRLNKKQYYKIGILVGPEGGIDTKEIALLKENGATIVTLGRRILRCETAPITMVSNILYELES